MNARYSFLLAVPMIAAIAGQLSTASSSQDSTNSPSGVSVMPLLGSALRPFFLSAFGLVAIAAPIVSTDPLCWPDDGHHPVGGWPREVALGRVCWDAS